MTAKSKTLLYAGWRAGSGSSMSARRGYEFSVGTLARTFEIPSKGAWDPDPLTHPSYN
jgi:hypothetical protein